jgi:hypothetical protein
VKEAVEGPQRSGKQKGRWAPTYGSTSELVFSYLSNKTANINVKNQEFNP